MDKMIDRLIVQVTYVHAQKEYIFFFLRGFRYVVRTVFRLRNLLVQTVHREILKGYTI